VAVANAVAVRRRYRRRPEFMRPVWFLLLAVAGQVTLGATVVLTGKAPVVNTLHVALGAVVLVTSLVITLRAGQARFGAARPHASAAHDLGAAATVRPS
jgi:heme A synthase